MPVRRSNIASTIGFLLAGLLRALLLLVIAAPRFSLAQDSKQAPHVTKTSGNAQLLSAASTS
jgi:hypothetical protein